MVPALERALGTARATQGADHEITRRIERLLDDAELLEARHPCCSDHLGVLLEDAPESIMLTAHLEKLVQQCKQRFSCPAAVVLVQTVR